MQPRRAAVTETARDCHQPVSGEDAAFHDLSAGLFTLIIRDRGWPNQRHVPRCRTETHPRQVGAAIGYPRHPHRSRRRRRRRARHRAARRRADDKYALQAERYPGLLSMRARPRGPSRLSHSRLPVRRSRANEVAYFTVVLVPVTAVKTWPTSSAGSFITV